MTVLEFAKSQGYQTVKKEKEKWNGYTVYSPGYDDGFVHFVGLPYVILVKNGKARMSDLDETLKYMGYKRRNVA